MNESESEVFAIRIIAENRKGVLKDISTVVAHHDANVLMIHQELFDYGILKGMAELYLEFENGHDHASWSKNCCRYPQSGMSSHMNHSAIFTAPV